MGNGGTALKEWRERRGWSQQRLATELGLALPTISQWERGVIATPRREHIEHADAVLGADGQVVSGYGYAVAAASEEESVLPEVVMAIERLTDALAAVHEERALVLERIEAKVDALTRRDARSSR